MKALVMLSGGIDSPVAAYMLLKNSYEVVGLHMDNRPFTDDTMLWKVKQHVKILENMFNKKIKLYIAPHGINQIEFIKNADRKVGCLLCRRLMWRVANEIAIKEHCDFIATGESIGQVASQTLKNIQVESEVLSLPIIRPLAGLDKMEIVKIAKEIGTYETSITPSICCQVVPDQPATNASLEHVKEEEAKVDINKMLQNALQGEEIIQ
ncbi:MAG: tRNA sulfurtransferase [Thermoplasmata archaeon]